MSLAEHNAIAIMTSGGLDSLVAYYAAKRRYPNWNIVPIWVNLGQPYADKERESVLRLPYADEVVMFDLQVCRSKKYFYKMPTVTEQILTGRNMLLANIGANFGNKIWINALKGELSSYMVDKNHTFFAMSTACLSYTYGNDVTVETPFLHTTKAGVVKLGLELGLTVDQLSQTSSCYDEKLERCGVCRTCFKRKVAMVLNGIFETHVTDPFDGDYAYEQFEKRHEKEPFKMEEIREAYRICGKDFDNDLRV